MQDEFNLESYSPRPVNPGLGFHEEKDRPFKVKGKTIRSFPSVQNHLPSSTSQNDSLKAFYETVGNARQDPHLRAKRTLKKRVTVSFIRQLIAWPVDLILVTGLGGVTLGGFALFAHFFTHIKATGLLSFHANINWMGHSVALFLVLYLLYFTYTDLYTSPGKRLLGIKMAPRGDGVLSTKKTFIRAFISLASLLLLGIPSLLDMQGKLSDTGLYRRP